MSDDEFKQVVDPGYKQHETFYGTFERSRSTNVHNGPSSDLKAESKSSETAEEKVSAATEEEKQDAAIDNAIRQLAHIVGELEFQMGLECVITGDYYGAFEHFKLSTHHNHPGGAFNLGLCYEQGVGVKRNMKTAKRLYEIAASLGHAKALYNLGVFHAQGLGGARKNFKHAKTYFESAAALGSVDAVGALSLLLPPTEKLIIDEAPDNDFYFKEKPIMSKTISAISKQNFMRIAVS